MKISELVKKLNAIKKERGDIGVFLDMKQIEEAGHDEYTHEDCFELKIQKIGMYDMDTQKHSKRKHTVVSIQSPGL